MRDGAWEMRDGARKGCVVTSLLVHPLYLQQHYPLALRLDGQRAGAEGDDDILRASDHTLVE